jgi:hypothetical protein
VFNKGIFNLVSDEKIVRYIAQLNKGELVQGRIRVSDKDIPIFLTHPTGWRYDKEFKTLRETSLEKIKAAILKSA